jgi:hypothetical protein
MKTKFKLSGRRVLSALLCLLMAVTALPMSAFAWTSEEGKSCTSSFGDKYVGSDGENYYSKSSYSFIVYDSSGGISVRSVNAGNAKRKYLMNDGNGTHQVYCIESGIDFSTGNSYVSQNGNNSSYFRNLPTDAQFGIMMALMYGWHEGKSSPVAGTNADDYAFATQTIIWEYQQQLRTSPSDLHSANGIDGTPTIIPLQADPPRSATTGFYPRWHSITPFRALPQEARAGQAPIPSNITPTHRNTALPSRTPTIPCPI